MYKFKVYKDEEDEWNLFNEKSKNGTFLFNRKYMGYHQDRFTDFSLLIYDKNDSLIALLPASTRDKTLFSHEGLTYGGFVTTFKMTTCDMVNVFTALKDFLKTHGINSLIYKSVPQIYLDILSQEDQYALFANGARLIRRDVYSVIDYFSHAPTQERRLRARKKAEKANLVVESSLEFSPFWDLLTKNLLTRYKAAPTHSLKEIEHLASLFSENIRLFVCRNEKDVLAGVVLYISKKTIHTQYISASEEGFQKGALDLLFFSLIEKFKENNKYFSFGISNENNGLYLNEGLISQKEGFGARSVLHDTYELNLV